jgi:hypothetical protein
MEGLKVPAVRETNARGWGTFVTAAQVLHPHIVLHVSISRVNTTACIENAVLVC